MVDQSYIDIELNEDTGKTKVWVVKTKPRLTKNRNRGVSYLGEVRWFGRWRGYAFFPYPDTAYEHKCMREIAAFVEEETRKHRSKIAKKAAKTRKKKCSTS